MLANVVVQKNKHITSPMYNNNTWCVCALRPCFVQIILTSRRHCLSIPPLLMFFSASSSPKLSELAKIRTSAILTNRCRKLTATSIGIPWVGSITSNSELGLVAEARRGRSPPHAMIKLSASWEIRCTVLTTKMAFSLLLTKSKTLLVEWERQT